MLRADSYGRFLAAFGEDGHVAQYTAGIEGSNCPPDVTFLLNVDTVQLGTCIFLPQAIHLRV
jgi:hypothetical protein